MNPYAMPTAATALGILILGVAVLIRERKVAVNVLFFVMTLTIGVWLAAFSGMYCAADEPAALWWAKAAYLGVPFIPAAVYHFTIAVLRLDRGFQRVAWAGWAVSAAFSSAILTTDALISGLYRYSWGYYPRYGWLSVPYLAFFFSMMAASLGLFWVAYRRAQPGTAHAHRIRSLLIAFLIAYLASVDYLPKYGVAIYPFGYLPVLLFLILAARTIRRFHLVDLTPAFAAKEIIETMHEALIVCDVERTIRLVNRQACALFGYRDTELLGKPVHLLLGEGRREGDEQLQRALAHPSAATEEIVLYQKGGHPVDVSVSVAHLLDRKRQPVGVVVIARDIRERKRAERKERALAAAASAAAASAKRRAEELNAAYQEIKQTQTMLVQAEKLAALGQLASGIAHEVKNPLGILLLGLNYLERGTTNVAEQAEVLQMMREAIQRSDTIIHGLLDFSRPASMAFKAARLPDVIETSLVLVERQLANADNIRITKAFVPDLPPVSVDEGRMQQVFINLLLNAAQAMPQGGSLTIRCYPDVVTDVDYAVGRRGTDVFQLGEPIVVCEVEDTGSGIPAPHLSKVFDPFFTTRSPGEGTGLGLTITKSIVEQHHGLVQLESVVGRGTTVRILLPVAPAEAEPVMSPVNPASAGAA